MAKSKTSVGLYCAIGMISRGRPNAKHPGDLFVPSEDELDFLLANEMVREATEAEQALWEKTHVPAAKEPAPKDTKQAAAPAADGAGSGEQLA